MPLRYLINLVLILALWFVLYTLIQNGTITNYWSGILITVGINIILATSLNVATGYLGQLPLGHAGFMAVGAYAGGIFMKAVPVQELLKSGNTGAAIPYILLALLISAVVAGIFGILIGIPALRLRGDYLAIVTLAFGEIIKNIINCVYVGVDKGGLHLSMKSADTLNMENGKLILNGPQGAVGIMKLSSFTSGVILILFALFIVLNLVNSKAGRAVTAIRDNRIAAESVGIGITRYKLTAFITSAVLAGMAGAMYAMNFSTIAAKKFDFNASILILVFVVLGGMSNIPGTIVATTLLYMLPELLREYADYRMLLYAIVLIIVMLLTNSEKAKQMREVLVYKFKNMNQKRGEN